MTLQTNHRIAICVRHDLPMFAHLSDLHVGKSAATERAAEALCRELQEQPGTLLLTGDVTHRGLRSELRRFYEIFEPVLDRMIAVPGNHDRLNDDLRDAFMPGERVQVAYRQDLFVVRLDSTGPHNRRFLDGHGMVTEEDLAAIEKELRSAPPDAETVLLLHHHPLALPDEHPMEKLATLLGWPNARELRNGSSLLWRIRGLCDAVLHGHRHVPAERSPWPDDARPLRIFNAGSSTELRSFRSFRSARAPACWISLEPESRASPLELGEGAFLPAR
jgi:3',5'-cyclic AMP phosphodiesterase CpdA